MSAGFNTVRALINAQATNAPHATYALATESNATLSYGDLARQCRRFAAWLSTHGVAVAETVSVVMPNGLATLQVQLGTLWAGRCINPVNLLAQPDQMRYVLDHSDCKLVFVSPDFEPRVREMLNSIPRKITLVVVQPDALDFLPNDLPEEAPLEPVSSNALALLMYTSGTTGQPKGVMLTQANLAANAQAICAEHALTADDRVLGVLPLYHINAVAVTMLAPLAVGGSVAMAPKFSSARFWAQTQGRHCTWINVVPTIISFLLEGDTPARDITAPLRFCRSASAPLSPEHLTAFENKFGIGIIETMGLTETVAPAFSNPLNAKQRKIGSVGRSSGCEAAVIDAALHPVADGATGEIVIRGPNVMQGYYKNPAATAASFTPDGWLRTGDLGYRDADGFFFVNGRIKELIIKGGENIAPREIDEAVLLHPAVLDAAAVGIPDKHYGQEIMVCVVLRRGEAPNEATEAALRAHCEAKLGRYKSPKVIRFVSELPRGPSGKVQRLKLLDPLDRLS